MNANATTHTPAGRRALAEQGPLEVPVPDPHERREREQANATGTPYLLFRDHRGRQRLAPLVGERLILGRSEDATIAIRWDAGVSRHHATLEYADDAWWIEDAGRSLNGTFVNRVRVSERRRLEDRDLVQVGDTPLSFCAPRGQAGRFAR